MLVYREYDIQSSTVVPHVVNESSQSESNGIEHVSILLDPETQMILPHDLWSSHHLDVARQKKRAHITRTKGGELLQHAEEFRGQIGERDFGIYFHFRFPDLHRHQFLHSPVERIAEFVD